MLGRLQDFSWQSRELGVEVVEEGSPDVDDEPRLGLSEQLGVRVGHAPLVPDRQECIKDAGAGVQDGLDVLGARTQVGKAWMFSLQLPQECDHGQPVAIGDPGTVADSDEVAVEHGVDSVHGARGTGCLNEVLGILQGSKDHVACDLRGLAGDEGACLQPLDVRQQHDMGRRTAGWGSGFVRRESLDDALEHLRLVPGRQGCKSCHERLPSRPLEQAQVNGQVVLLRIEIGVGPNREAFR